VVRIISSKINLQF